MEKVTGVKDGAGTGGGVEGEGAWRDVHNSPADPNCHKVDKVK